MLIFRHFSGITAPVIAGYHANTEWRQQGQQFSAGFISTGAKSVGYYTACFGVIRVPEPVLPGFAAHKAPLLIKFADESHISMGDGRRRYSFRREFFKVRITVLMPIFSTLAVSRTPAPLKAISVMRSLTPGFLAS